MTAQAHEGLILDGERTSMAFCPPLPKNDPRITRVEYNGFWTACWRGYVGTWEIKGRKFYLRSLRGGLKLTGEPIYANWFTGTLRVPRGEMLHYVHMGFGSIHEEELHIKIAKGAVINTRVIDNRRKKVDKERVHLENYPGGENRFDGDDQ